MKRGSTAAHENVWFVVTGKGTVPRVVASVLGYGEVASLASALATARGTVPRRFSWAFSEQDGQDEQDQSHLVNIVKKLSVFSVFSVVSLRSYILAANSLLRTGRTRVCKQ